jgi:hypothetical protein
VSGRALPDARLPGGYRLDEVLGRVTPSVRDEVVGMWLAERVLPPAEATRRASEVVVVARAADGEIAGVSTAYVASFEGASSRYWFYRMFVRPSHRGVWAIVPRMFDLALAALRAHDHPERPLGIAALVENRELMRPATREEIARAGLHRLGADAAGRDVWCLHFDGSVPSAPAGLRPPR